MSEFKLPEMTKESLVHVNCTPDKDYPLRILMAHRSNCNVKWSDNTEGKTPMNPLLVLMNKHCDERAELLDNAIAILKKFGDIIGCKASDDNTIVNLCKECNLECHYGACHSFMQTDDMIFKRA